MANYKEQLRRIWKRYRKEVSTVPVDLKTVAAWAIGKGLWAPRPVDLSTSLANDLAQTLREEKRVDKAGREFRANIPVIPTVIDQNPCAHLRMPRDMIFHGWSMRLFQAWQHSATMSS